MIRNLTVVALSIGLILAALPAYGFPSQDPYTMGWHILHFSKRRQAWMAVDAVGVDGRVHTSPPDTVKFDRRVEGHVSGAIEGMLLSNVAGRLSFKSAWLTQKEEEETPPKSPIERSFMVLEPGIDLTFINPKGLELTGGVALRSISSFTESQTSASASSSTEFDSVDLLVPRIGIIRRAANWNGGLYYVQGRETSRGFTKTASDESETSGEETVFLPTEIGIIGNMLWSYFDILVDFALIEASGGGLRSADGITIKDDYLRIKNEWLFHFGASSAVHLRLGYNSLSYANNAFMSMDTIPVFSAQLLMRHGSRDAHIFYGAVYGNGSDGQSIPEFNSRYSFQAYGGTIGVFGAL